MENQKPYERIVEIQKPYRILEKSLPYPAKIYRAAYDNAPLSNPPLFYRKKTLLKMLVYLLFKIPFLKFKKGTFIALMRGKKYTCKFDPKNTQFHAIYFDRFVKGYEPETCALLELAIDKKSVFCDIGCNWGFFIGYVASKETFDGHIYAFEPQEKVFQDLSIFIKEAALTKNTTCYQVALSDRCGYGNMRLKDGLHSGLAELIHKKSTKLNQEIVSIKKLDDYPLSKIDVMKIDAEGHEYNILIGASLKIDAFRPIIIFEYLDASKNAAAAVEFLEAKAYAIFSMEWEEINNSKGMLRLSRFFVIRHQSKKHNLFACPKEKTDEFLNLFTEM